jgi:NADP-dependent 3-hydroxy acid dehydrogenase YdfG
MSETQPRTAVVTGASSGIGAATARAIAAAGYRVALLARRTDRITSLAEELGDGALAIEADVTDRDSLLAAADRVQTELGGAAVLVNNAGVMLLGPFATDQRDDYRRMVEVNLLGAITATEVFLDQLRAAASDGGADIVNISSVAGRTARAGNGVYAATKWGVNGWSESLRQELLPDVRVTLIEPGAWSPPSSRPTSPTRRPGRASAGSTTRPRSRQTTSPRSSPSPSAAHGASPSTRSCCDLPASSETRRAARTPPASVRVENEEEEADEGGSLAEVGREELAWCVG